MKRIFKKAVLTSLSFLVLFSPVMSVAQENSSADSEDIKWRDEEDEQVPPPAKAVDTASSADSAGSADSADDIAQAEGDEDKWMDEEDEQIGALQPEKDEDLILPPDGEKAQSADTETAGEEEAKDTVTAEGEEEEAPESDATFSTAEGEDTELTLEEANTGATEEGTFADQYEQNLYDTYIQYYSKKVSVEEWNNITGNKDIYTIQKEDTLWDISKVLFGDPHYWPKLWSSNPGISNPHLIHPEGSLGFIHGTEGSPPSLNIVQGLSGKLPQRSAKAPPDFLKGVKINIPGSKKPPPIMQNIPSSLPPLRLSDKKEDKDKLDLSFGQVSRSTISFLRHYMAEKPLSGSGIISGNKEYGRWFHAGQTLLLEMTDPVNPGQKLTVIQNKGKLYSSVRGVRGPFGYQVDVQGEVEVIGRVEDSFDLYEAKVTQSFSPVTKGALVLNKSLIQYDYKKTDVAGSSSAQIIGVPSISRHEKQVASPYSLVYLNRGLAGGLSVGQMYQVKANSSVRDHIQYGYEIKVGEVKIIYTEQRFATGIITAMSNPIHVGDYITSLNAGLITQSGYDPLNEDVVMDTNFDDSSTSSKKPTPPPSSQEKNTEFADDDEWEDAFEAF